MAGSDASPVTVGEIVASKYRVDAVLGQGGMGVVVAATHTELDQKVALKFLLPKAAADANVASRFLREARASARLKSPHVARTLDTGQHDGRPFIVMEYLEGRDLAAELEARSEPIPIPDAVSWLLQACDALAEAHGVGIVHRDLKPANLFLALGHDGRPAVKVLDFGISKLTEGETGTVPSALTTTGAVFGSPAYMSPEQMRASREVDARADIWALGVALYELLTRRVPFAAKTSVEMIVMVTQDPPTPPRSHRADLPADLERIILKCLEKDPANRFPTVSDLANALAGFAHARDHAIVERIADIASQRGARPASLPPRSSPSFDRIAIDTTQAVTASTVASPPHRPFAMVAVGVITCALALVGWRVASSRRHEEPVPAAPPPPSVVVESLPPPIAIAPAAPVEAPHDAGAAPPSTPKARPSTPRATVSSAPSVAPVTAPDAGRFFPVRE